MYNDVYIKERQLAMLFYKVNHKRSFKIFALPCIVRNDNKISKAGIYILFMNWNTCESHCRVQAVGVFEEKLIISFE